MEVVAATPSGNGVPPFHNHDVREWSRIDSLTGVLERARLETDHWATNSSNSSHKYGKVVDTRARSDADGAVQQRARRQLEVFQSSVPGGHLQVIKTHTVSSSRWSSKNAALGDYKGIAQQFGDLELSLNPLDLSSQKSKATVGRSVGRRPPSRSRSREDTYLFGRQTIPLTSTAASLHRVSRLCHQIHDNAVKQTFGKQPQRRPIHERESGDGVEIVEIESVNSSSDNERQKLVKEHPSLARAKSSSSEDLHLLSPEKDKPNKSVEDLEDLEQLRNWRRTSKIRRSLQFPKQSKPPTTSKPHDLPVNTGSVRKIREDLETGRRLNTALRGNNVDLEALDQILQSISNSSSSNDNCERAEKEDPADLKKQKRNSFVTVESLQEVKGRLRRTSSPTEDIYKIKTTKNYPTPSKDKAEEADDGIVTEDINLVTNQFIEMPTTQSDPNPSRVRTYVYGMEAMLNKKPMVGTGSLESRPSKQLNGVSNYRSEDWYNRRKSYGFEQVHSQQESIGKNKNLIESSTDSGICRSSEIVQTLAGAKNGVQQNRSSDYNSELDSEKEEKHKYQNDGMIPNIGSVKRYTSIFEQKSDRRPFLNKSIQEAWKPAEKESKEFEGTTITIPIKSQRDSDLFKRSKFDVQEKPWKNAYNQDAEIKRHSIAVDESKYVSQDSDHKFRRTSLTINDKSSSDQLLQDCVEDDATSQSKRQKKVEFCKTEVHFAADSGRVNIVATDEKPPPTNNFRRRRRNSAAFYNQFLDDMNKNGLPVLHFGDSSYEKNFFRANEQDDNKDTNLELNPYDNEVVSTGTVTVSTNQSYQNYPFEFDDEQKENLENEIPKGILKNKPVKPKPYLLGDENFFKNVNSENEENGIWGVKLRPVQTKPETPMWRSTVTLKNTFYDKQERQNATTNNFLPNTHYDDTPLEENFKDFQSANLLQPDKKQQPFSESYNGIRIVPSTTNSSKPLCVGSDALKQTDELSKAESKGYSTKVNIRGGEVRVIDDHSQEEKGKHPTWPGRDDLSKDGKKQLLNKGLVVRIGGVESKAHTVCSKTTTVDSNSATTTTKITIDLSSSPNKESNSLHSVRLPRATLHNFKSTSLVLNTFKSEPLTAAPNNLTYTKTGGSNSSNIPQQLEALKKLYEDWQSDSEADKEVQSLMNKGDEAAVKEFDDDNSSVVSGSWSKMRAFKNMQQQRHKIAQGALHVADISLKPLARVEKDFARLHIGQLPQEAERAESPTSTSNFVDENIRTWENQHKQSISKKIHSPVVLRKTYNTPKNQSLKTAYDSEKLSSPSLVVQNASKHIYESIKPRKSTELPYSARRRPEMHAEEKGRKSHQTCMVPKSREVSSSTVTEKVNHYNPLRQSIKRSPSPVKRASPRYSPMRQNGERSLSPHKEVVRREKQSPSPTKKAFHCNNSSDYEQNYNHVYIAEDIQLNATTSREKSPTRSVLRNPRKSELAYFGIKTSPSPKSERKLAENKKPWNSNKPDLLQHYDVKEAVKYKKEGIKAEKHAESPHYENIDEIKRHAQASSKKEFDSSILDELTKAADQILQAVNDYAEDSHKKGDEGKKRTYKKEVLDTISETKSWKQGSCTKYKTVSQKSEPTKPKLKHTSSTSSVESVSEHRKSIAQARRTSESAKLKKKANGEVSTLKAATKARRLQRANSREALLQSHGSSSEDLPVNVDVQLRKPRLVRKTKAAQPGAAPAESNKTSSPARKPDDKSKNEERVPVGALPEIRHKTAISTIRSTAEKNRERAHRSRNDDTRKKSSSRRDSSRAEHKADRIRSISSKDPINHRICTANIKKCNKSEETTKT